MAALNRRASKLHADMLKLIEQIQGQYATLGQARAAYQDALEHHAQPQHTKSAS